MKSRLFARVPRSFGIVPTLFGLSLIAFAGGCGGSSTRFIQLDLVPQNPNTCGETEPHTLEVRIYQLKDVRAFEGATLEELWSDSPEVLLDEIAGTSVLTRVYPGKPETFRPVEILAGAKYFGVAGNFCATEGDCWKATTPIDPTKNSAFALEVRETCLTLMPGKN